VGVMAESSCYCWYCHWNSVYDRCMALASTHIWELMKSVANFWRLVAIHAAFEGLLTCCGSCCGSDCSSFLLSFVFSILLELDFPFLSLLLCCHILNVCKLIIGNFSILFKLTKN
jgi:hypothetical protein